MRPIIRAGFVSLIVSLAVFALAQESWASFAGGSRLLFYYTQKSIVNGGAPVGSAATIVGITNQSTSTAVDIRLQIFNGTTCSSFGPVNLNLAPRRTLRFVVSDYVSPATFPEGYVDVWAVNSPAGGQPIRWDQLSGKGTILDFGGSSVAVATYEAAALFSDADRVSGMSSQQGQLIADNTSGKTAGAFSGTVDFWGQGGSFGTGHRLVLIPVSEVPGSPPASGNANLAWYKTDSTQTRNAAVAVPCMLASPLAPLHPSPSFNATYPNDGTPSSGGNINIGSVLGNKGIVGALFETATSPSLLVVHSLQSASEFDQASHE